MVCINKCLDYSHDLLNTKKNAIGWVIRQALFILDYMTHVSPPLIMEKANTISLNMVYCLSCHFYSKLCYGGYVKVLRLRVLDIRSLTTFQHLCVQ